MKKQNLYVFLFNCLKDTNHAKWGNDFFFLMCFQATEVEKQVLAWLFSLFPLLSPQKNHDNKLDSKEYVFSKKV